MAEVSVLHEIGDYSAPTPVKEEEYKNLPKDMLDEQQNPSNENTK